MHKVFASRPRAKSATLLAALTLLAPYYSSRLEAQDAANLFTGRTVTITVSCERAGTGNFSLRTHASGAIELISADKRVQIVNGTGGDEFMSYSASISGNQLTVKHTALKLAGVSFTEIVNVSGNSCSAQHLVEPGEYMDSIDPSCRATRCAITPQPRPVIPQPSAQATQRPTSTSPNVRTPAPNVASPTSPKQATPTAPIPSSVATHSPTVPSPSVTCGSTITGPNFKPAPKEVCDKAKQSLSDARQERQKWFGSKTAAKNHFEAAQRQFKDAGDALRAHLARREANSPSSAPFEEAEQDADDRNANIEKGRSEQNIARKIELGAFESGSCADLRKAADYYLEAARGFLKADEFGAVNALLLRKDQLEAIADDAQRRGICGQRSAMHSPRASTVGSRRHEQLAPYECQRLNHQLEQLDKAFSDKSQKRWAVTQRVQLAAMCPSLKVSDQDCERAEIAWALVSRLPVPQIEQLLRDARCRYWEVGN